MAFVEHYFPRFVWGDKLEVREDGTSYLVKGLFPSLDADGSSDPQEENARSSDLIEEYLKAPKDWSKKHTGKHPPHVQFANADTDQKLMAFVKQFGPVVVKAIRVEDVEIGERVVEQDIQELRNERNVYRAAMVLTSELGSDHERNAGVILDSIAKIADGLRKWPLQLARERRMRHGQAPPAWHFDQELLRYTEELATNSQIGSESRWEWVDVFSSSIGALNAGHRIICTLLNAFRTKVYRTAESTFEGPDPDLGFGVRPLLYYILRRIYLGQNSIAICANEKCCQVFEVERSDGRFCGPECSRLQRQRDYWTEKGKARRSERRNIKRSEGRAGKKKPSSATKTKGRH